MTPSESDLAELSGEIYRRTNQAKKRLNEINRYCESYKDQIEPLVVESSEKANTVYKIPDLPELSDEIALLTSEVIHHLRSALDNLIVGLVSLCAGRRLTNKEEKPISFPILDTKVAFDNFCKGKLSLLDSPYIDLLYRLQPINMKNTDDIEFWIRRALRDCRDYSNHDKHRRLPVVGVAVSGSESVSESSVSSPKINFGGIQSGKNFAQHLTVPGFGEVSFRFTIYRDHPRRGKVIDLSIVLDQLCAAIQDDVIPMFLSVQD